MAEEETEKAKAMRKVAGKSSGAPRRESASSDTEKQDKPGVKSSSHNVFQKI